MIYLPDSDALRLYEKARFAAKNTYSPYSGFPVGCAVLAKDGSIFSGANVENASYSVTICAERTALGYAIANGNTDITAVAVYSNTDSISPCGTCRQFIIEFGKDIIIIFKHEQRIIQRTIQELLPFEFTKTTMQ
jgi:cytidine deaminase